jgi:phytanoyl-CoA dioxygenase PhyH
MITRSLEPYADADRCDELVATPAAAGGRELAAALQEHGYVFCRDVLDARVVEAVTAELSAALCEMGLSTHPQPPPRWTGKPLEDVSDAPLYESVSYRELCEQPALLRLVAGILGEDEVFVQRAVNIRHALPGDDQRVTPPHQDHYFVGPSPNFVTVWLPVVDIDRVVGGLVLAEGSHELGLLPHVPYEDVYSYIFRGRPQVGVRSEDAPGARLTADFRPGDVLVFGSHMVHGALRNTSDVIRVSLDVRMQPATLERNWQALHSIPEARHLRAAAGEVAASLSVGDDDFEVLIAEMMKRGVAPEPVPVRQLVDDLTREGLIPA